MCEGGKVLRKGGGELGRGKGVNGEESEGEGGVRGTSY